jgi:hypothetical protein
MRVTAHSPVSMRIARDGSAAMVFARADIWSGAPSGWKLEGSALLQDTTQSLENKAVALGVGDYRVVFTCRIEKTANGGVFDYVFSSGDSPVFFDKGNVDATAAATDARGYQAEFDLTVQ